MVALGTIFALLIVYQVKHFLADYPLQTPYMLSKFKPGWEFLKPLAAHCAVHAAMTFVISFVYLLCTSGLTWLLAFMPLCLAALDFAVHFGMDRLKAGPKYLGRYKALSGKEFMNLAEAIKWRQQVIAEQSSTPEGVEHCKTELQTFFKQIKDNAYFWWSLGLDQGVHHLTHYGIIYLLLAI